MPRKKKADAKTKDEVKVLFSPHIPENVIKQAEKADELLDGVDPDDGEDPIEDPIDDEPVVAKPQPTKQPDPAPAPAKDPEEETYKHKYSVLQGMYNKSQDDIKMLNQAVANLQEMFDHQSKLLSANKPAATPAREPVVNPDFTSLNADDFAGYGDEIVNLAHSHNKLLQYIATLEGRIGSGGPDSSRLENVERMVKETVAERYSKELDKLVPKWREVVNSPEFVGWLNNVDEISGYRFKDMMDYAFNNFRSGQAAAVIRKFGAETGIDVGSHSPAQAVRQESATKIVDQTKDPLAHLASPDETVASDGGASNQPKQYPTRDDVAKASALYAQKRITIEQFNDISNRFMEGVKAAKGK